MENNITSTELGNSNNLYIYIFLDNDENILYIGKTTQLRGRMIQHFYIEVVEKEIWKKQINLENIILLECKNATDLELYETYLINKYNPLHNKDKVFNNKPTFDLPYLEPITYKFEKIHTRGNGKFADNLKLYIDNEHLREDITKKFPLIKKAYETIGSKKLKSLGYNSFKIKNELKNLDNQDNINTEITKLFITGNFYSSKDVKVKLANLYIKLGISKKAKATDIEEIFNVKFIKKKINTKTVQGYQL